jgi:hypothetical protein
MYCHATYNLWFHDDAELSESLGNPVVRRTTLHEWPLSVVQRVECADGSTHIYKVQASPTVEPDFYAVARSPIVVGARVLPADDGPAALLLDEIEAPHLSELELPVARQMEVVEDVLGAIGQIDGDVPAMYDLRTRDGWHEYSERLVNNLQAIVDGGGPPAFTEQLVQQVDGCRRSPQVHEALDGPAGYVHNDLLPRNVLVVDDGYRVLDWQRPIWAPVAIDRATLLEAVGVDPRPHVPPGALMLRWMLQIGFWPADWPPTRPVMA